MTASGDVIASLEDAAAGVWIDADRFLAYRQSTKPDVRSLGMTRAFLGSLSSGDMIELDAHPITRIRGIEGWLEVVNWPGLETVFEDESRTVIGDA